MNSSSATGALRLRVAFGRLLVLLAWLARLAALSLLLFAGLSEISATGSGCRLGRAAGLTQTPPVVETVAMPALSDGDDQVGGTPSARCAAETAALASAPSQRPIAASAPPFRAALPPDRPPRTA